eukprot:scaffold137743_cov90-Phaeocystis_antarctica.AAC.1
MAPPGTFVFTPLLLGPNLCLALFSAALPGVAAARAARPYLVVGTFLAMWVGPSLHMDPDDPGQGWGSQPLPWLEVDEFD